MHAYKCIVAYDGSRYNGWQKQGNTANTIQQKLEMVLSRFLDEAIEVHGSGRTDMGVHALGQVFHFHCKTDILASYNNKELLLQINGYLPGDIKLKDITECDLRFHARLNAKKKTYVYRIDTSLYGNVFERNYVNHINEALDVELMKRAASYLVGTHDFKSFTSNKRMKKSSVRTIFDISIEEDCEKQIIMLTYTGDGFLYNMVRIMTGTLIEVGLGKRAPESIQNTIDAMTRESAGFTAPAQGLFLVRVDY